MQGLYKLHLDSSFSHSLLSLDIDIGTKHSHNSDISSMLWHKCLGHFSKDELERLVKNGVLLTLDFINFDTCIICIKKKQVKSTKKSATRSLELLEVIYTDICGPFPLF